MAAPATDVNKSGRDALPSIWESRGLPASFFASCSTPPTIDLTAFRAALSPFSTRFSPSSTRPFFRSFNEVGIFSAIGTDATTFLRRILDSATIFSFVGIANVDVASFRSRLSTSTRAPASS